MEPRTLEDVEVLLEVVLKSVKLLVLREVALLVGGVGDAWDVRVLENELSRCKNVSRRISYISLDDILLMLRMCMSM